MKFLLKTTHTSKIDADLLVLFVFEGFKSSDFSFTSTFMEEIVDATNKEHFHGKEGESLVLYTKGIISAYKLLVVGLGKEKDFDLHALRKAASFSIKSAQKLKSKNVAVVPLSDWFKKFDAFDIGQAIVEGFTLGGYKFLKYKGAKEKENLIDVEEVYILCSPNRIVSLENGVYRGKVFANATIYARDLINEPASFSTPTFLANCAKEIARNSKNLIKVSIYEKDEVRKMGMGSFLGVARGSSEPPKFIVLRYKGTNSTRKIALVGKGITFDTGGLSIKPAEHMMTMKMDMAGAAAILAIFDALPKTRPKFSVIGIIAACENMPSGNALKPGDILTAMNGKTIEVLNTDAEGRLTFADALSYAVKEKPYAIIDLATLTGACMVALGGEIAGMWGNDDKLSERMKKAAKEVGEKVWLMPLEKDYKELIKSDVADIKNIQTGKYGGAITAALFLEEFVDGVPWVHLDIAGPAYEESDTSLVPKGGAGFGVRTILQYLLE